MGYFPLCVDIGDKKVLLMGDGPQIRDKMEKLTPFGAELLRCPCLKPEDLTDAVAFVVAGDLNPAESERVSSLCRAHGVPVNVVDQPALCTFFFPAIIARGDLTVSVSTGGRAPGASALIRQRIGELLPDETEAILDWIEDLRERLHATLSKANARVVLREATRLAFDMGRPLTDAEMMDIFGETW